MNSLEEVQFNELRVALWRIGGRLGPRDGEPMSDATVRQNLQECVNLARDVVPPTASVNTAAVVTLEQRLRALKKRWEIEIEELRDLFQRTLHVVAPMHTAWIRFGPDFVQEIRDAGFKVRER